MFFKDEVLSMELTELHLSDDMVELPRGGNKRLEKDHPA